MTAKVLQVMFSLKHISIGIRSQATIVLALTVLWWLSLFHGAIFSFPNLFWVEVGYFCPFVMILFAMILLVSYRRTGRTHKWFVRFALLGAASPWIFLILGFICSN